MLQAEEIMKFIVDETHFTGSDVLDTIFIFEKHQYLNEFRSRYQELIALDLKPHELRILLRSRKDYLSYVRNHCGTSNTKDVWHRLTEIETRLSKHTQKKKYNWNLGCSIDHVVNVSNMTRKFFYRLCV